MELLVVISIIGVLATVVFVGARPASEQSRDTQRQADLREVQTALELYKNRHGRYPEGCNAAGSWSGQVDTDYECSSAATPYIVGDLAENRPFAEFMLNLPQDVKLNGENSGYVYTTNADGTVYKFMAKNTVEADELDYEHPFRSCEITYDFEDLPSSPDMRQYTTSCNPDNPISDITDTEYGCDIGMCDRIYQTSSSPTLNYYNALESVGGASLIRHCKEGNEQFETSYAVWGGVANPASTHNAMLERISAEAQTERVICTLP